MSRPSLSPRELRKRLLLLEAEACRLEARASLAELRNPMTHLQRAPALLGLLGGTTGGLGAAAALLSASRLAWLVTAIPLALAGWRIARRLRQLLAARSKRH